MIFQKKEQKKDQKKEQSNKLSDIKISKKYLYLLVSILIGFTIAYFFNFKMSSKGSKLQELVLLVKGNCYHIHHSIIFSVIISAILFGRYIKNDILLYSFIGFLIGMSGEDLLFKDWDLVKNNCHKSKLIKFMQNTIDVNNKYN